MFFFRVFRRKAEYTAGFLPQPAPLISPERGCKGAGEGACAGGMLIVKLTALALCAALARMGLWAAVRRKTAGA